MDKQLEQWIERLDGTTAEYDKYFSPLDKEALNWRPEPHKWSIAQCIDHVVVTNESYYPILEGLKAGTYKPGPLGRLPLLPRLFGKMIISTVGPERKRKVKTFPIWEPTYTTIDFDVLEQLRRSHERLKESFRAIPEERYHSIIISSPANRHIVYPLADAMEILALHGQRHLEQAKEVMGLRNSVPVE